VAFRTPPNRRLPRGLHVVSASLTDITLNADPKALLHSKAKAIFFARRRTFACLTSAASLACRAGVRRPPRACRQQQLSAAAAAAKAAVFAELQNGVVSPLYRQLIASPISGRCPSRRCADTCEANTWLVESNEASHFFYGRNQLKTAASLANTFFNCNVFRFLRITCMHRRYQALAQFVRGALVFRQRISCAVGNDRPFAGRS
jgi:hypothetical protein